MKTIFGRISADLPKLAETEVWLRKISKGLAAKKKAGVGGKREEERGGTGWVEEEGRDYK